MGPPSPPQPSLRLSVFSWKYSLRFRILGPLIVTALLAAVAVAGASYWLGSRWATAEIQTRFEAIEQTLADSNFPLNAIVLESLAELTQTELVTLNESQQVQQSTVAIGSPPGDEAFVTIGSQRFLAFRFDTVAAPRRSDRVFSVMVLFDEALLDASRGRAAMLPLVTGLSTILALSTITFLLTSRLVGRIGHLQQRVEAVAAGDFTATVSDQGSDEVGRLGTAVDHMAAQLDQLWKRVHRQQSEKLLHQIASGMAHQLRNSLTGARLAVELHANECDSADDESLQVAIRQIELSEDYVRRLLLAAAGRQDRDRPMTVGVCWTDIHSSLKPVAEHLKTDIQWQIDDAAAACRLADGPSWVAAVSNLIHNAIQAGDRVWIEASLIEDGRIRVRVADNGPGIPAELAADLFEPFATTKPEGMGLGLSVVQRAAEHLQGQVQWRRENQQTLFEFTVSTH